MTEPLLRKEQRDAIEKKFQLFGNKMRESLAETSKSKGGLNVLRYLLHESRFLVPLSHSTTEKINTDLLIQSEAKRLIYLGLRTYMDTETIKRVEMEEPEKKEETDVNRS